MQCFAERFPTKTRGRVVRMKAETWMSGSQPAEDFPWRSHYGTQSGSIVQLPTDEQKCSTTPSNLVLTAQMISLSQTVVPPSAANRGPVLRSEHLSRLRSI